MNKEQERVFEEHLQYEQTLPPQIRTYVFERDRWGCRSCNSDRGISPHHILFKSLGGKHNTENLVTLCFKCHNLIHTGALTVKNVRGNFFFGGRGRWK